MKPLFRLLSVFALTTSPLFVYADNKDENKPRLMVAINHDDLNKSDYIGTRQIYEKYGFKANFNFILKPFNSVFQEHAMVENVKLLIKDGNHLGLHAVMGGTFWWLNKMFDVRPDGTATFAPRLEEVKTALEDGKNVFGYEVTGKKMSQIGFTDLPTDIAEVLVDDITQEEYEKAIAHYSFYYNKKNIKGLDLNGEMRNWPLIQWLEYWYNELIDSSLGYSTISESITNQFEADYQTIEDHSPSSSYPDAYHLEKGTVVKFDDIDNPNYSNPDYQKVGYFKHGLFKDCISNCNYEVADRCIEIAKAFCKHYFGTDVFTNYGRHGKHYCSLSWIDNNTAIAFDNREKTIALGEGGNFYHSRTKQFKNGFDILLEQGFTMMTGPTNANMPIFESQIGLYEGQSKIRFPYFCCSSLRNYLDLIGTSVNYNSSIIINDEFFRSFTANQNNLIKFFYENAGTQLTNDNGEVAFIHSFFKSVIDHIRSCVGTGRIPSMSFDTIRDDTSVLTAVELLCLFCQQNGFTIVPLETARQEAMFREWQLRENMFPNPTFENSLLPLFGGTSSSADAYLPDGWNIYSERKQGYEFYLTNQNEYGAGGGKLLTAMNQSGSSLSFGTKIYGLPACKYELSFRAKGNATVRLFLKKMAITLVRLMEVQHVFQHTKHST